MILRRRALDALHACSGSAATIVVAPAGYGKTALLRAFADETAAIVVIVRDGATFARFASDVVEAASAVVPGLDRSYAGAFSRALQTDAPEFTLARWFVRQLGDAACRFVVDGIDRASEEAAWTFVRHAIELSPSSIRWLVASRQLETLSAASLLAFGHASLPFESDDLRLQENELHALARRLAPAIDAAALEAAGRHADGQISRASLLLAAHACGAVRLADTAFSFDRVARRMFDAFSDDERRAAFESSLSNAFDRDMAADRVLNGLRLRASYLFEAGGRRFHAAFAAWLADRFATLGDAERDAIRAGAAARLERAGDVRGALALLGHISDERLVLASIERHAATALEREHLHFLHDAIARLCDATRRSHPLVLAFVAMEASLGNRVDLAESLFTTALATARERESPLIESIRYWYACELVRRDRSDAIALLRPDAALFGAPKRLRSAMMSTLGVAYAKAGNLERATAWVGRARKSVERSSDDALRAYVHHHAAFVALSANDGAEARRLAERAVLHADAAGSMQVATAATSVLYAIAMDYEDDLERAAAHVQRMGAYAARAGNVAGQLYALAAIFEIETDRGNAAALAAVERELAQFDLQYGAALESETIVPAQAIQHAWRGEFDRAYRLLEGSDEQQFSDDRRALRLAEIALYAAAARHDVVATCALDGCRRLLAATGDDLRASRARGFAAIALVLLGRCAEARTLATETCAAVPSASRTAALGRLALGLAARRNGGCASDEIRAALDAMRRLEWTGLARLVESLPSDLLSFHNPRRAAIRTELVS